MTITCKIRCKDYEDLGCMVQGFTLSDLAKSRGRGPQCGLQPFHQTSTCLHAIDVEAPRGANLVTCRFSLVGVLREQNMLKGHLPRVIYHQIFQCTKKSSKIGGNETLVGHHLPKALTGGRLNAQRIALGLHSHSGLVELPHPHEPVASSGRNRT